MSTELNEIELKILLETRKKSIEEVADLLGITPEIVRRYYESASQKLSMSSTRLELVEEPFVPIPRTFRLEKKIGEIQIGTMKVGSKILEMLSKGIYTAPWNSLKELISNSFDADATTVEITYYPKDNKLIVIDNGMGMDYIDFDEHFTFIVKSEKRKEGLLTEIYKRPVIGKIGIGFIAVNELCNKIKVISSKKGSDTNFEALIDFSKIVSEEAADKEFYEVSQFELINYKKTNPEEHFTIIELLELKDSFIDILNNKSIEGIKYNPIYPNTIEEIVNYINNVKNIKSELGPYWEFLINFANTIPIVYLDKGPFNLENIKIDKKIINKKLSEEYKDAKEIMTTIKSKVKNYNFNVIFNGIILKKPILLPHQKEADIYGKDMILVSIQDQIIIDENSNDKITIIDYYGYFFYQRTRIIPEELRGMVIRIKNVAIGDPSLDFWEHPYPGDMTYFPQVYGEIYILSGLEEAMNIDRSTFKSTHPEFYTFKDELHKFLRQKVFQKAKNMYGLRRKDKALIQTQIKEESRDNTIKNIYGNNFNIIEVRQFTDIPVQIKKEEQTIFLNTIADQFDNYKKDDRILLQDVAIALEIAYEQAKDKTELKNIFWKILRELSTYRM